MGGHVIVHRWPDASLKAQIANVRLASAKKWRIEWRIEETRAVLARTRLALASLVTTAPHPPWVPEEVVRARRPRSLIEDNPTSG
jgi:hypothetical protein